MDTIKSTLNINAHIKEGREGIKTHITQSISEIRTQMSGKKDRKKKEQNRNLLRSKRTQWFEEYSKRKTNKLCRITMSM